ncbi:DUF4241 domain-containing protein [Streptomyces sp. NPDC047002]|uniref:DUF4241 domain-containing protein n=1 Tax=Streptomyces sp. NPDC047002 TaxID=3155475 RepID=UPI003452CF87
MPAPDFARLLAPGSSHRFPGADHRFVVRELPGVPLSLPSGRVVAAEPLSCGTEDPTGLAFAQEVGPGTYPVVLVTAQLLGADGKHRDTRVAAARLAIRDEPVAAWEPALLPGEDPEELDEDALTGYPVDGGTGCFADADAFRAAGAEEDFIGRVAVAVAGGPRAAGGPDAGCAPVTLSVGGDEHAVVVFRTGWGDGDYPTWIGRTARGDVACFLTDFGVLSDDAETELDPAESAAAEQAVRERAAASHDALAAHRALRQRLDGLPRLTELLPGSSLRFGSLASASGGFLLVNQDDGDVVIHRAEDGAEVWRTGTLLDDELVGLPNRLVLQESGDLAVFAPTGVKLWSSGTRGREVARAVLGDDGRLVLVGTEGGEVWSSQPPRP